MDKLTLNEVIKLLEFAGKRGLLSEYGEGYLDALRDIQEEVWTVKERKQSLTPRRRT